MIASRNYPVFGGDRAFAQLPRFDFWEYFWEIGQIADSRSSEKIEICRTLTVLPAFTRCRTGTLEREVKHWTSPLSAAAAHEPCDGIYGVFAGEVILVLLKATRPSQHVAA